MLGVPAETQHVEAVEERGEPTRPILLTEVDRIDASCSEFCGSTFRAVGSASSDVEFTVHLG